MRQNTFKAVLQFSTVLLFTASLQAQVSVPDTDAISPDKTLTDTTAEQTAATNVENRVSVEVARDRARLMHDIYAATLGVMHDRYFHGDRAIVPARAMEDVFEEIQRQSNVRARWIAVNLKPMSVTHEAETEFEKRAKKEIAEGKAAVDVVEGGFYRRAGAIPLTSNCISCHAGFFRTPPKKPKFAALVISVPIQPSPATQSEK